MRFLYTVLDSSVFCDIAIGYMDVLSWIIELQTIIDCPSHNGHERSVTKRLGAAFGFQLNLSAVIGLVTRFTKRDEIVRTIATGLTRFEMMDVQDIVFAFAMAMLTLVVVTEQDIFPSVPKAELFALLVLFTANLRILEQLRIELRHFHDDVSHGKNGTHHVNNAEMAFCLLPDGWREPAFFPG